MAEGSGRLVWRLQKLGLSDAAITAAWPDWWSNDAEGSASAHAELRFSLARKLGLDPRSLLEDGEPRFVWRNEGKFKRLSTEDALERAAISSFGASLGRALLTGARAGPSPVGLTAHQLRESILRNQPFVRLVDLLGVCWGIGVPVIHLKVFPLSAKRMCAMATKVRDRFAILLGKEAAYPAPIAYFLAHEIGHVALGHLNDGIAVIDLQDPLIITDRADSEEIEADRYALELLTGSPEPIVTTNARRFTAQQLAKNLLETATSVRIEPGTLALCFGHSTGNWEKANAAMKVLYARRQMVSSAVNRLAIRELNWSEMPDDLSSFVKAVMGEPLNDESSHR